MKGEKMRGKRKRCGGTIRGREEGEEKACGREEKEEGINPV